MKKRIVTYFAAVLFPVVMMAQQDSIVSMSSNLSQTMAVCHDTLPKWEFHCSMGSDFVGSSRGNAIGFSVSPSVVYRPNDLLTIKANMTGFDSYNFGDAGRYLRREPRNLAPYRDRGSVAGSVALSATYKVTDRLWIAASYMHLGGEVASGILVNPWLASPMPMLLDANAFSASLHYRFSDKSYIDIHFTHIEDRTGALTPLLFDNYYYGTHHGMSLFNCQNMLFDTQW